MVQMCVGVCVTERSVQEIIHPDVSNTSVARSADTSFTCRTHGADITDCVRW